MKRTRIKTSKSKPKLPFPEIPTLANQLRVALNNDVIALMFVTQAVRSLCKVVLEDEEATVKAMDRGLVSGELWIKTAKTLRDGLAEDNK